MSLSNFGFRLPHQSADSNIPAILVVNPTLEGFIGQVEETIAAIRADENGSARIDADLDAANDLLAMLRKKESIEEAMAAFLESPYGQFLVPEQAKPTQPERRIGFRTEKG